MKCKKMYAVLGVILASALVGCGQKQGTQEESANEVSKETQINQEESAKPSESAIPETPVDVEPIESPQSHEEMAVSGEAELEDTPEKIEGVTLDQYAESYKQTLIDIQNKYNEYCMYTLYDIDENGIKELITIEGTCEADDTLHIYSYDVENSAVYEVIEVIGKESLGDVALYKDPAYKGIIAVQGKQGYEYVKCIDVVGETMVINDVFEKELAEGEEYYSTDEPILTALVNDYTLLGL